MKALLKFDVFILLIGGIIVAEAQQTAVPPATPYSVVRRSADWQVWSRTVYQKLNSGEIVSNVESYVECGSGLNFKNAAGAWTPSSESISILPDGSGAATNAPCKAYFPPNIYSGAVTLVTAQGIKLQSQPVCLVYTEGTNSTMIAELTNSIGELVNSNEIIYPGAVIGPGISADLEYVFHKSGLEQSLMIRSQLPPPGELGFDSADPNLRVQLITEFFNCPSPGRVAGALNPEDGLRDTQLAWGNLRMIQGKAFLTGKAASTSPFPTYKNWVDVNGRALLVEQAPFWRVRSSLARLPAAPAGAMNQTRSGSRKFTLGRILPAPHLVRRGEGGRFLTRLMPGTKQRTRAAKSRLQIASAGLITKPGLDWDYITVTAAGTNWVFQGDTTYFIANGNTFYLYGTTVLEGGSVIKADGSGNITIDQNGSIDCQTAPYLISTFTSWNDNSIGISINGSSGSPDYQDVDAYLNMGPSYAVIQNCRFTYAKQGVQGGEEPNFYTFRDCQFLNVETPIDAYDIALYNDLIGFSASESADVNNDGNAEIGVDDSLTAANVTSDSGNSFIMAANNGETMDLANCLITSQSITNAGGYGCTLLTNQVVYLPSPSVPVYQTVGGGSYYLTNDSPYRAAGTSNIDGTLLSELTRKTTYPPIVYSAATISTPTILHPQAQRNNPNWPDIGYSYDPLDYVFGGCDLYSNLTFTAGTAVGWFYEQDPVTGIRDAIIIRNGGSSSFNGTVTQPCYFARHNMVQEGGNGNWNDNAGGYLGAITFDGNNISGEPQLYCNFTKWTSDFAANTLRDDSAYGAGDFRNCEFYCGQISMYKAQSLDFTNCLFFRALTCFWDQDYALSFAFENCTFYGGCFIPCRYSYDGGISSSFWLIENCSFDGTAFNWADNLDANPANTLMNYNAYNTNNLSWQTYQYFSPTYGTNEVVGPNDVMVNSFNWQASWFGNFYLPDDPGEQDGTLCIDAGSTTADQVGLYHFTTQVDQVPETNSIVDIGYHYVATDPYGNPLDSNGDGIPDYLEDANGNGLVDSGEIGWDLTNDLGLTVIIAQPENGSVLP